MACPNKLLNLFSLVLDIHFCGVQQAERASYLLCDSFIELTCREAAIEMGCLQREDMASLEDILRRRPVKAKVDPTNLGLRMIDFHKDRNPIHHSSSRLTVPVHEACAYILLAAEALELFWPGTQVILERQYGGALRVIDLFSQAPSQKHDDFYRRMREYKWLGVNRPSLRKTEIAINPGDPSNWGFVLRNFEYVVLDILDSL